MDWNKEDERKEKAKGRMRNADGGKQVMALSRARYRSVTIYETPSGFGVFLGLWFFIRSTLQEATALIDHWLVQVEE